MNNNPINNENNLGNVQPQAQPQVPVQPQAQPQVPVQPVIQNGQVQNSTNIEPQIQPQVPVQPVMQNEQVQNSANIQQQMQNIPTVDQSQQTFINNTQTNTAPVKAEKKGGINIVFVIILFVIIFAAIFLLFPYIFNNLG